MNAEIANYNELLDLFVVPLRMAAEIISEHQNGLLSATPATE